MEIEGNREEKELWHESCTKEDVIYNTHTSYMWEIIVVLSLRKLNNTIKNQKIKDLIQLKEESLLCL